MGFRWTKLKVKPIGQSLDKEFVFGLMGKSFPNELRINVSVLISVTLSIYLLVISIWLCGALFYDVAQGSKWGWLGITLWVTSVITSVTLLKPVYLSVLAITVAFLLFLAWWLSQRPSNDRNWEPNFSKPCRVQVSDDNVVVQNVRNTEYRSLTDYDVNYETRKYRISDLKKADLLILFWGSTWMSHPMVIFNFGEEQHLCFSVEARYRKGQNYSFFGGLYRQYELMYVVSDERDAILLRTKFTENQDCYLYRLKIDAESIRKLFHEFAESTNRLHDSPQWYNAVTNNCTTAILKSRREKVELDVRFFLNGALDRLLYERGQIDNRMPFEELKKQSRINDVANLTSAEKFHTAIREQLPFQ